MDETKSLSQTEGSQPPVEGPGAHPDETKSLSQEFAQGAEKATAVGLNTTPLSFSRDWEYMHAIESCNT
jgi:hypothetical protein